MIIDDNAHTTIRIHGGGLRRVDSAADEPYNFDTAAIDPFRLDPRYSLSLKSLGQLERLAKARFILSQKAPEIEPSDLDRSNPETARSIIRSVFASSEIEGEGVAAEYVEAFVTAHTEPGEHVDQELELRLRQQGDIIETYWWALEQRSDPIVSYDFVLEAHRRMFANTRPEIAGRIKERDVRIQWSKGDGTVVAVPTIPASLAEPFLRALCERTSRQFKLAEEYAEAPMLLVAAEFLCDYLAIHPFTDGNGRTARLLSTYLLERGGYHFTRVYPLDQVVLERRADYYETLNRSQRSWHTPDEDLSPWIKFFVDTVFEQWERGFRKIRGKSA